MHQCKPLPCAETLWDFFDYDPAVGVLINKKRRANSLVGKPAGNYRKDGYILVTINYTRYLAHRIIWKMQTGEEPPIFIDHKDRNPRNNKWSNLRASDPWKNQGNRVPGRGKYLPGVKSNGNKWCASCVNGYLGQYATEFEAHTAYVQWHINYFGSNSIYAV